MKHKIRRKIDNIEGNRVMTHVQMNLEIYYAARPHLMTAVKFKISSCINKQLLLSARPILSPYLSKFF